MERVLEWIEWAKSLVTREQIAEVVETLSPPPVALSNQEEPWSTQGYFALLGIGSCIAIAVVGIAVWSSDRHVKEFQDKTLLNALASDFPQPINFAEFPRDASSEVQRKWVEVEKDKLEKKRITLQKLMDTL
jgi:hypothetical protein